MYKRRTCIIRTIITFLSDYEFRSQKLPRGRASSVRLRGALGDCSVPLVYLQLLPLFSLVADTLLVDGQPP